MTRGAVVVAVVAAGAAWPAGAALNSIADLYNTGVNNAKVALPNQTLDPHYTFAVPPPTGTAPIAVTSAVGFPIPPWLGDSATSAWLVPSPNTTGDAGDYAYRTTFNVPVGINLDQLYVAGLWASDNAGTAIRLNGLPTGISKPSGFDSYSPFVIKGGFVSGLNTLEFVVNEATGSVNNGGFTGLRVEMVGRYVAAPGRTAIPTLRNSGVSAPGGSPLPNNSPDPSVTLGPQSEVIAPVLVKTTANGFPIPPWLGDGNASAWLVPTATTDGPEGDYYYQTAFDLTGFKPETVEIYGRWASDNPGMDIMLNGAPTGNPNPLEFGNMSEFTLSTATGETFLPGINTLTFVVHNGVGNNNPTGVRWEFLSATAEAVPEPGLAGLVAASMAGMALRRRGRL
jgi:hypothetical protein